MTLSAGGVPGPIEDVRAACRASGPKLYWRISVPAEWLYQHPIAPQRLAANQRSKIELGEASHQTDEPGSEERGGTIRVSKLQPWAGCRWRTGGRWYAG